jgi:hypothetical protein
MEKTIHIAQVLSGVTWPTSTEHIDALVAALSWTRLPNDAWIDVRTGLDVSNPTASFLAQDGQLLEVDVFVSDFLPDEMPTKPVRDAFLVALSGLTRTLGRPSGQRGENAWWDCATRGRLHLDGTGSVLALDMLSQRYADIERGEARLGISPDRLLGQDE